MTGFQHLLKNLHDAEHTLMKQLAGIRTAISSLEMGSAVSPAMPDGVVGGKRKRRKMSAAARARISAAQKARWAKQRAKGSSKKQ
jgi:hypothetical protein